MITLATAAYAHHSEVNAYRLNSITTRRIARFAAPKITIALTFEKNSEPHVAITYSNAICIVCRLIDVHDTISPDVHLQRIRGQRPQYIERRCSAEHEKRQHTPATLHVGLEQKHAQRQQERQKPLRIQHERRAHVVRHRRRENTVQAQPDKSFDELMNGE